MNAKSRIRSNFILNKMASLKITVFCLIALAVLTLWGTFYQVENGLYLAQERFFNSYLVFSSFIPFPSARTVIWILFFNLIAALIVRFNYTKNKAGLVISHGGLVILLISGFLTLNFSHESYIGLQEGESSNIASDYMKWELVLKSGKEKKIIPESELKESEEINFAGSKLLIENFYINARLFETPFAGTILKELDIAEKYEENNRALVLIDQDSKEKITLEGEENKFHSIKKETQEISLILRKKAYQLPFRIELIDVKRELHPGTDKAKSYSSKVRVQEKDLVRELVISMNKPFRSGLYTVYQASFGINEDGQEFTALAAVKNISYTLPYIGSLLTSLGLFIHFIQGFFRFRSSV